MKKILEPIKKFRVATAKTRQVRTISKDRATCRKNILFDKEITTVVKQREAKEEEDND